VNWGGTSSSGTWYVFDTANSTALDFELDGTTSPMNSATSVTVETAGDGSGSVLPAQAIAVGTSIAAFSITRTSGNGFVANAPAIWSLINKAGGIVDGDLVTAVDNKSALFTPHAPGSAVIQAVVSGLTSVDSGVITAAATPTNPSGI